MTGVTVAHSLKREGKRVALLEMRRVGLGTTGNTTAQLTVGHSLVYAKLSSSHGVDAARLYAESNAEAISQMETLAAELGIECDWEPASNFVYTESSGRLDKLEEELEAMRGAGILAEMTRETDLPFPVAGAIRAGAPWRRRALDRGTAACVATTTCRACTRPELVRRRAGPVSPAEVPRRTWLPDFREAEATSSSRPRATGVRSGQTATVETRSRSPSRRRWGRSGRPRGMYISIDEPTRSIRSAPSANGNRQLIAGGESRRPGDERSDEDAYRALEEFMRAEFGVASELRWSAHDYIPADGLPYIGRLRRGDERLHVATGFAKWGLTKATIAARIITDAIVGRSNPWAALYDTRRWTPRASAKSLATENGRVARRFVAGAAWLGIPPGNENCRKSRRMPSSSSVIEG